MLIDSPRLRPGDREAWDHAEAQDRAWATTSRFRARVEAAEMAVVQFARGGGCYAGVSWGKDSTVLADLVARLAPAVPMVWVRVEPIYSPECPEVRDAFRRMHPEPRVKEIVEHCRIDADGAAHATGTLERGFARAERRYGRRYLTGIRGEESGQRDRFRRAHRTGTDRVCAPLVDWRAGDVYAYLADRELPVHPAYAMTMGGALPRERIRVASLGGQRGTGTGRAEWERAYYPDLLASRNALRRAGV